MSQCRICNQTTHQVIHFGKMPIANGFLRELDEKEFLFDMSVAFCPQCFMVQLEETVKPEMMFNDNYQFVSSTSNAMAIHFEGIAQEIAGKVADKQDPFIVELGCNDGIMLKHIAAKGIHHLGIEPSSNVAAMARKNKVEVTEKFFNAATAQEIVQEHGQADVLCGSNVFCHIEDINSVFEGASILLKDDGVLFFEDPYLLDIVQKSSFDQIYDEHVYYYSGLSVQALAQRHGLQLVDMVHQDVHGGSMRYYIQKGSDKNISQNVNDGIAAEKEWQLHQTEGYEAFKTKVDQICKDLKQTLKDIKQQKNRIVAYGATSKSTTLLNYAQIGPDLIEYICDTTPNKINKYTPGTHIPIKSYDAFLADDARNTLLLAWNHKKEIFAKEKSYREKGGKFITYFPEVVVE